MVARFCHGAFLCVKNWFFFEWNLGIEFVPIEQEEICLVELLEVKAIGFGVLHGQITAPYLLPPAESQNSISVKMIHPLF